MNLSEFLKKYENTPVEEYPNSVSKNIKVSVCVQTYQHEKFIAECLDSILLQKTDFDFEILLGEDQSSDGTRDICIDYAKKYPEKIRLFLHRRENNIKINNKPTGRFNFFNNIYRSEGNYIAICEGDDYWSDPNKLQKQVDFLDLNKNYNIASHNVQTLNEQGVFSTNRYRSFPDGRYYLYRNFTPTLSLMYRRTEKFDNIPDFLFKTYMVDFPLSYFISDASKIKVFKDVMGVRRVHAGGVWSQGTAIRLFESGIQARKIMKDEISSKDLIFLNAGINRLEVKKYIAGKKDGVNLTKPELIKNAKYVSRYRAILSIASIFNNSKILTLLDKVCNY